MPIIKSAIKRMRTSEKGRVRNLVTKKQLKEVIKKFLALVEDKKLAEAAKLFPQVQKTIDTVTKKNIWHSNKGNRKKSQLFKLIEGHTPTKKAVTTKKPVAKK